MTHLDVWADEVSLESEMEDWLAWIAQIEQRLGHSADGNQCEDGYSLDGFYLLYQQGKTPDEGIEEIGSVTF